MNARLLFMSLFLIVTPLSAQKKPQAILKKVDMILRSQEIITKNKVFPAYETVLRVFKKEGECEIWANEGPGKAMVLVLTLPVCAVDRHPGPKLKQGDGKTPEGFFEVNFKNGFYSTHWFMWINLDHLGLFGIPGKGSCFKTFIEYPTSLDRFHTRLAGYTNPGGAIFMHGNCVSDGCVSFKNRNYLPVFSYARHAFLNLKSGGKGVQIHIFPFRFDRVDRKTRIKLAKRHATGWSPDMLLQYWNNLEAGFTLFNKNPHFLKVRTINGPIKPGENSTRVAALKRFLEKQGLFRGNTSSQFDLELQNNVKRFQRNHHLSPDGVVGLRTMRSMHFLPPSYNVK